MPDPTTNDHILIECRTGREQAWAAIADREYEIQAVLASCENKGSGNLGDIVLQQMCGVILGELSYRKMLIDFPDETSGMA